MSETGVKDFHREEHRFISIMRIKRKEKYDINRDKEITMESLILAQDER